MENLTLRLSEFYKLGGGGGGGENLPQKSFVKITTMKVLFIKRVFSSYTVFFSFTKGCFPPKMRVALGNFCALWVHKSLIICHLQFLP